MLRMRMKPTYQPWVLAWNPPNSLCLFPGPSLPTYRFAPHLQKWNQYILIDWSISDGGVAKYRSIRTANKFFSTFRALCCISNHVTISHYGHSNCWMPLNPFNIRFMRFSDAKKLANFVYLPFSPTSTFHFFFF